MRSSGLSLEAILLKAAIITTILSSSLVSGFLVPASVSRDKISTKLQMQSATDFKALSKCSAPTWDSLKSDVLQSETGIQWTEELDKRKAGDGMPHTDAKVRLFGTTDEPRVTFYRDTAAWCPYCQKVWIMLEEKKIPYRVEKINMRSYGDKPDWFLEMVPSGLLPAMKLDGGNVITDSLRIMGILESEFTDVPMLPEEGDPLRRLAQQLLQKERELFSWWCQFTFRPGNGARDAFERTLLEVDELLSMRDGPWFLGGDRPSIVDLAYITHIERMVPSVLYWKGYRVRGSGMFPNIERWLRAFELRPSYMATKSDYYTHVMDIPPQYGPGFSVKEAAPYAGAIDGSATASGGSPDWTLPLPAPSEDSLEPIIPECDIGDQKSKEVAALRLVNNSEAVVQFALRGAGAKNMFRKRFQAPLADPYAEPSTSLMADVDAALRHTAQALLQGVEGAEESLRGDLSSSGSSGDRKATADCLRYLRDRVGVPRDMPFVAARQLRAHLNWAITIIEK